MGILGNRLILTNCKGGKISVMQEHHLKNQRFHLTLFWLCIICSYFYSQNVNQLYFEKILYSQLLLVWKVQMKIVIYDFLNKV